MKGLTMSCKHFAKFLLLFFILILINTFSATSQFNAFSCGDNTNGQLVKSATISAQNANVDVASLSKGNYVVTAELNWEKISQKVIKK